MATFRAWLGSEYREQNFDRLPEVHNLVDHARKKGLKIPLDSKAYTIKGKISGTTYTLTERLIRPEDITIILK